MNSGRFAVLLSMVLATSSAWSATNPTVSTQKGPLRLELTLSKQKYRLGEPIWFRAKLTNIGKKDIRELSCRMAADADAFRNELRETIQLKSGLNLIAKDAHGRLLVPYVDHGPLDGCPEDWNPELGGPLKEVPVPPEIQTKVNRRTDELRKQGLGPNQIDEILDKEFPILPPKKDPCSGVTLKPGQYLQTPTWVFKGFCKGERPSPPIPPGHFAELIQFKFKKPGIYQISAVYDKDPQYSPGPVKARLKTPPITVEILP